MTSQNELLVLGLAPKQTDHADASTEPSQARSEITVAEGRKFHKSLGDLLVTQLAEEEAKQDPDNHALYERPKLPTKRRDDIVESDESGSDSNDSIQSYRESSPRSQYEQGLTNRSGAPDGGSRGNYLFDGGSLDRLGARLDLEQELEAKDHSKESPTRLHIFTPLSSVPCTAARAFSLGPVNYDSTTAPPWPVESELSADGRPAVLWKSTLAIFKTFARAH